MQQRNSSLDALRGLAILCMILSGSIAYGDVLAGWMFHAQVPPPMHQFNASIFGITWVDLVFPFFLFSMGAAIPLSLKKYIDNKSGFKMIVWIAGKRFLLLVFFALFTEHMRAWVIADVPGYKEQLLSLLAFLLVFFQFFENRNEKYKTIFLALKLFSFFAAAFLLWKLPFWSGKGFDFYKSDIIIIVLANMAFFGTLIYYFTATKPYLRMGLLAFIMAVFLAAKEPGGGWAKEFFNFNHIGRFSFDWMYQFYFLKYLFIIIPGTIAGEWMWEEMKGKKLLDDNFEMKKKQLNDSTENMLAFIAIALVCVNLVGLFTRMLSLNLIITILLCGLSIYFTRTADENHLFKKLVAAGTFLLLLGLSFEAYEGGIRKDTSTYSYYFVTSGLAFFMLLCFSVMAKRKYFSSIANYFSLNGKNPMVAYVAGNLLLLPLLSLTALKPIWDGMNQNAFMGLMKGGLFTGVVSLITIFFVKRKWFWKT